MNRLFKKISGITLGLALCFGFSFSCSNKQSNQMARALGDKIYSSGAPSFGTAYGYGNKTINDVDWYFTTCGNNTSVGWNKASQDKTSSATLGPISNVAEDTKYGAYQTSSAFTNAQKIEVTVSNADKVTGRWYIWYSTDNGSTWNLGTSNDLAASTTQLVFDNEVKIGDSVLFAFGFGTSKTTGTRINLSNIDVWEGSAGGNYTSYDVTVHYNDGVTANDTLHSSTSTGKISQPIVSDRDGYEFVGWYSDSSLETAFDFSIVITGDCDIYAKWNKVVAKLATPAPVFDKDNKQVTWDNVANAISYTLVIDGETTINNVTSPYSVVSLASGVNHTITVKAIGDGTNYSDSEVGSVNVAFLGHAGTEADPYTVEDARLAIDSNTGKTNVYATGIVSKITTAFNSQYGNISYEFSSDGLTTSVQLRAYRGKSYNGENFTSADDIQVGDVVVVKGNLTLYGNSTYEFEENNQLVSLYRDNGKTLSFVAVEGEMAKTSYLTNEQWNPEGISLIAYYDDNTQEDVTNKAKFTYSPSSPAAMGVTEEPQTLDIIITYQNEFDNLTADVTVAAPSFTDSYHLSGRKYIFEQASENAQRIYMNIDNASASVKPSKVTSKGEASIFLFTLVGDDTYTITNLDGTKGLYHPGSGNTVCWGTVGKDYQWVVNDTKVTKTVNNAPVELYGSYNFIGKDSNDNNRYLCSYNDGSDWRTYDKADATNREAMIQVETAKEISGFSVDTTNAIKNVLKGTYFDAQAAADAGFVAQIDYKDGTHDPITTGVTWTLETSIVTSEAVLVVSYKDYDDVEITGMNIYAPTMVSLSIDTTTNGVKTSYFVGDNLDVSGVIVKAYDSGNHEYDIEVSQCTFSPTNGSTLSAADTTVTVSYVNEDNSVATGSYAISVNTFTGYTKVTSTDDLEVGATYIIGVDTSNPTYRLMGSIADDSGSKSYRHAVDASSVMSTDATRVADNASALVGAARFTLLKNAEGQYAFYDLDNSKYLTGYTHDGDNHLNDSASFGSASWWTISFSSNVMSATLSGTNRVLAYNYNSGNDPRFATYGGYSGNIPHIALFKMDGSTFKDNVTTFTNDWLKMNDDYYSGDKSTPECSENYELLKIAYSELNDVEKNIFQFSDDYIAARARLNNWATANGQVFTYGNDEPFASLRKTGVSGDILSTENDSSLIVLFIICTLGAGGLSAFYLMKKKKRA